MPETHVRAAGRDDLPAVAALRWRGEVDGMADPPRGRDEFVGAFIAWAHRHTDTHSRSVVVRDGVVVGAAWLAQVPRPPSAESADRVCGDLQGVYVLPEVRGQRWGSRLVEHVLAEAGARGMESVTVHSSGAALSLYARAGFVVDPRQLIKVG